MNAPSSLISQLGFAPTDRAVIVNADDFGMSRSSVQGISTLLASGGVNSTTLMSPCGWAPGAAQIARSNPQYDVGVHLVFTSEWESYRWGPIGTQQPTTSLVDEYGYFPRNCKDFEEKAQSDQVEAEIEAQIIRAKKLGVPLTHADNHMGSLYGLETGRDFLEITLRQCAKYGLPFRFPRSVDLYGTAIPEMIRPMAEQLIAARAAYADELGVIIPDYTWTYAFETEPGTDYDSVKAEMIEMISQTKPGVTEIYVHPFQVDDELLDIAPNPQKRGWELKMFQDPEVLDVFNALGIHRIGWRALQQLQETQSKDSTHE